MTKTNETHFGALPPLYKYMPNPYPDQRIWRCPVCNEKTGQRTLPLLVFVEPGHFIVLKSTCRYCSACEVLIVHKHDLEHHLTQLFQELDPAAIGNKYFVMGTLEKQILRQKSQRAQSLEDLRQATHDFKMAYLEARMRQTGWFPKGQEPPIVEPPPSQEWVKTKSRLLHWR